MADAFSTATDDIENQRRAAVAAIAAGGSAGAAAFTQAQQQIAGSRTAALNAALADSASRGMTPAQQAEFAGTIGRPYDLLNATSQASAASHAAGFAGTQASADNYFRQIGAAVPLARTSLMQQIAAEQAKSKDELSDSELRTRLTGAGEGQRGAALEDARRLGGEAATGLSNAERMYRTFASSLKYGSTTNSGRTGAAGPLGPQGPRNAQGVSVQQQNISREDQKTLERLAQNVVAARQARKGTKVAIADVKAKPIEGYAREVGLNSGLDENRVRGLTQTDTPSSAKPKSGSFVLSIPDAGAAAGIGPNRLKKVTSGNQHIPAGGKDPESWYTTAVRAAEAAIKDGESLETFAKNMDYALPKKLRRVKALVLAQYGPAFGR